MSTHPDDPFRAPAPGATDYWPHKGRGVPIPAPTRRFTVDDALRSAEHLLGATATAEELVISGRDTIEALRAEVLRLRGELAPACAERDEARAVIAGRVTREVCRCGHPVAMHRGADRCGARGCGCDLNAEEAGWP